MDRLSDITNEDLQLYLDNELDRHKTVLISSIIEKKAEKSLLQQEQDILVRLDKFYRSKTLLLESSAAAFQIPEELLTEIEQKIEVDRPSQNTKLVFNFVSSIREAFKSLNPWSMVAGGAVTAFCAIGVLQISPNLLVSYEVVGSDTTVFRSLSAEQNFVNDSTLQNYGPSVFPKTGWVIANNIAYNVQISSGLGENTNMLEDGVVFVGDEFKLTALVLKAGVVSITYKTESAEPVELLKESSFEQGEVLTLPKDGYFRFSEPAGNDQISFYFDNKKHAILNFFVKNHTKQQ